MKSGAETWGSEERIPDVTMVGTELVIELGGASMPAGCSGGSGGGGPVKDKSKCKHCLQNMFKQSHWSNQYNADPPYAELF